MMQSFQVLLNRVKGDLRKARAATNEEKQKYNTLVQQTKRTRELVVDHEDEHDDAMDMFDSKEIDMLAGGVRKVGGSSSTAAGQDDTAKGGIAKYVENRKRKSSSSKSTESKKIQKKAPSAVAAQGPQALRMENGLQKNTRRNPHTGSIEIWNVEAMFSDSEEDEAEIGNKNARSL